MPQKKIKAIGAPRISFLDRFNTKWKQDDSLKIYVAGAVVCTTITSLFVGLMVASIYLSFKKGALIKLLPKGVEFWGTTCIPWQYINIKKLERDPGSLQMDIERREYKIDSYVVASNETPLYYLEIKIDKAWLKGKGTKKFLGHIKSYKGYDAIYIHSFDLFCSPLTLRSLILEYTKNPNAYEMRDEDEDAGYLDTIDHIFFISHKHNNTIIRPLCFAFFAMFALFFDVMIIKETYEKIYAN